jgi:branched-chain amino acid transport system permease protein
MLPIKEHGFSNFQFHYNKAPYYYIILGMLIIVILIMMKLERSRFGFYIRAIRENEEAARSLGVNSRKCKVFAAATSAFITACGGTFFAQYVLFIDPFSIMVLLLSVQIASMAILGGLGTIVGPMVGAIILIPISEFTRVYFAAGAKSFHLVLYGLIIMLMVLFKPEGLISIYTKDFKKWQKRRMLGKIS